MYEVDICTSDTSPGNMDQFRIWRSSDQGHGHTSKKNPLLSCHSYT